MVSNTICLYVNLFLVIVNILQILANFVVLIAWCTSKRLLRNDNLILLVSLAFVDFIYAVLQIPYLTVLIAGTKPNGVPPDYNPWLIILLGGPSTALLKSGWAITNAIAIDRVVALRFPVQYYKRSKRNWSIGAFAFAIVLAFIDWIVLQRTVTIRRLPYCTSFGCFTNDVFRAYSGLSNMVLTFLLCILITVILYYLCKGSKTTSLSAEIEMQNRHRIDKNANRVSMHILFVSALVGVVPGILNGIASILHRPLLDEIVFFVGTCATVSVLSHAFVIAIAHQEVRRSILTRMFRKTIVQRSHVGPM